MNQFNNKQNTSQQYLQLQKVLTPDQIDVHQSGFKIAPTEATQLKKFHMECLSDSLASHPENIFHHLLQQMGKKSQRWNVHSKCNEECTAYMAVKSLISKIHLPKLKESNSAQSSIEKIAPPNLKKKKIKITSLKNPIETQNEDNQHSQIISPEKDETKSDDEKSLSKKSELSPNDFLDQLAQMNGTTINEIVTLREKKRNLKHQMKNCIKSLHEVDSILYQKSIPFFEMILLDKLPLFQNDAGHYENQQDVFQGNRFNYQNQEVEEYENQE